jgi:hypothetical protein
MLGMQSGTLDTHKAPYRASTPWKADGGQPLVLYDRLSQKKIQSDLLLHKC